MSILYFDIETIPGQRAGIREAIAETITPPGNMSKQDTIDRWVIEQKPALVDAAYARAGLKGSTGEVMCISWALDNMPTQSAYRTDLDPYSEEKVLLAFFAILNDLPRSGGRPTFVGHNIVNFDLRFLWQRAVVCGVKPSGVIPFKAKPWDDTVFDTMVAWTGSNREYIKQDDLCAALGLPMKDGVDGSKVWGLAQDCAFEAIRTYCEQDVEAVRRMYKRMNFIADPVAAKSDCDIPF